MSSRLHLIASLVVACVLLAACSSTTVVARDERATADTPPTQATTAPSADEDANNDDDAASSDEAEADNDQDASADDEADGSDDDRGGRDDTSPPRELDVAEGFGLGGAEQLQSLLDDCEAGNDLACDILFQISAFDSDEETAAVTCGGRSDVTVTFCTAGIDAAEDDLVFDPESEGLDRVVEACEVDGNMTACDFLYYRSPIDSEFQEIGGTCGGRVNVAVPDCRSVIEE